MTNTLRKINRARRSYWHPTPRKWRKLGDAILGASTTAATFAAITNHPTIATVVMICGALGKFLTDFFKEDSIE